MKSGWGAALTLGSLGTPGCRCVLDCHVLDPASGTLSIPREAVEKLLEHPKCMVNAPWHIFKRRLAAHVKALDMHQRTPLGLAMLEQRYSKQSGSCKAWKADGFQVGEGRQAAGRRSPPQTRRLLDCLRSIRRPHVQEVVVENKLRNLISELDRIREI